MRQTLILVLVTLMSSSTTFCGEPEVLLDFRKVSEIGEQARLSQGPKDEPAIEVQGGNGPKTFTLIICKDPKISTIDYRVHGWVKYSGVEGDGYLELLNDFGPSGTYFSRSLADYDPLRKLKGTSDWREFELPFHSNPGMIPKRLILNIVLPGAGQVTLAQPALENLESAAEEHAIVPQVPEFREVEASNKGQELNPPRVLEGSAQKPGEWWSVKYAGIIGGVGGSLLGILGGLLGALMAWSQTRRIVKRLYPVVLAVSYIVLIVGIVALSLQQPYHVYFPILMLGIIGASVLQLNYFNIYQRFQDDEMRRMTALDIQ